MKVDFTGTVIHGTLRCEDIIPAFTEVLEEYAPERARILRKEYGNVYRALEDGNPDWGDEQFRNDVAALLDSLFDGLNDAAPTGYYFGAHPGDGSDFGFWPVDLEEE